MQLTGLVAGKELESRKQKFRHQSIPFADSFAMLYVVDLFPRFRLSNLYIIKRKALS